MFKDFNMKVKLVDKNAKIPTRGNYNDAGLDFYSPVDVEIKPRTDILIPLGLMVEFSDNFVLFFAEKSGIATKKKIDILAKIIDSGYRGIVHAHLYNNSNNTVKFNIGDKLVQGIVMPCWTGIPELVENLNENTERGAGGFGSTDEK